MDELNVGFSCCAAVQSILDIGHLRQFDATALQSERASAESARRWGSSDFEDACLRFSTLAAG